MTKRYIYAVIVIFSLSSFKVSSQVEYVSSETITNEAAFVSEVDAWFESEDSDDGQKTSLIRILVNGADPSTHLIILDFPRFANLQEHMEGVAVSSDFAEFQRRSTGMAVANGEAIYVHVVDNGKSWNQGDYIYTVALDVDPGVGSRFTSAVEELIKSNLGRSAPGMFRLVGSSAGSEVDYVAIFSASSLQAVTDYVNSFGGNRDFENYLSKVNDISRPVGSTIASIVKVWQ